MINQGKAGGLAGAGKLTELRQRLLFVVGALLVFRIGTFIPVPGVNPAALAALFDQQQGSILDMFNMFSGGALMRASLFALGIMPYISASIIMQLMTAVIPKLEQLKKEGEQGRRQITQYTRYGTVALATFQAIGIAIALQSQQAAGMNVVIQGEVAAIHRLGLAKRTQCSGQADVQAALAEGPKGHWQRSGDHRAGEGILLAKGATGGELIHGQPVLSHKPIPFGFRQLGELHLYFLHPLPS